VRKIYKNDEVKYRSIYLISSLAVYELLKYFIEDTEVILNNIADFV
jgi:hypothetical protein